MLSLLRTEKCVGRRKLYSVSPSRPTSRDTTFNTQVQFSEPTPDSYLTVAVVSVSGITRAQVITFIEKLDNFGGFRFGKVEGKLFLKKGYQHFW